MIRCLLAGHRWFHTVEEGRVVLEYSMRDGDLYFVRYQAQICTRCWTAKAREIHRSYLGDISETRGIYFPESYPEPGLPWLHHPY